LGKEEEEKEKEGEEVGEEDKVVMKKRVNHQDRSRRKLSTGKVGKRGNVRLGSQLLSKNLKDVTKPTSLERWRHGKKDLERRVRRKVKKENLCMEDLDESLYRRHVNRSRDGILGVLEFKDSESTDFQTGTRKYLRRGTRGKTNLMSFISKSNGKRRGIGMKRNGKDWAWCRKREDENSQVSEEVRKRRKETESFSPFKPEKRGRGGRVGKLEERIRTENRNRISMRVS
jgi:hypothetical protein